MKKITFTLLALICLLSAFSQHPQGLDSFMLQTIGSAKTLVKSKGAAGSDSGLVNSVYPDTASANFGKIKHYPGAMIRTGDSLWMRNYNATEWLLFSFGSSGAAYTADNGLTASTPTNFQLGGTLIQSTQLHNDAYSLTIDQDAGSAVDPFQVFANNNNAIVGNSVDQTGVIGSSTNGYGVQANSSVVGIKATAPIAGQFQLPTNDLVTEDPVIQLYRLANAAANGQGLSIEYLGSTSTGNVEPLGSIVAKWTDVIQATRTSMMEFYGTNSAVTARKMAIAGNGQLILDSYGVGAFTGTRTYNLGVDVSGNVIEVDTTAIVSESDPIALAKTITLTAGAGVSIAETATQALSLNPSWTITSNILTSQLTWSVLDILNTPPGSPADGDIYLVGTAGIGAWSGHSNEIATWDATGAMWTFETASTGDLLNNVDENTSGDNGVYKFNGSMWVLQTSVTTGAYWVIGGNSGYTNPKLGTIDNKGLRFIAHNKQWLTVASNKTITWNDFTGVGTGFLKVSAAGVMSRDNSVYITGNQTITLTGDVTGSGTTTISTTIASHAVSNAKFRQSAGLSVVGNSTNSTADVADITGTDGQVLRVSGTSLGFGTVLASSISSGANLSVTSGTNVTLTVSSGTGTGALLTAAGITAGWIGQLSVDKGGTGLAAVTAHYLLVGNGTSALTLLAPSATSGIPLISQGSSSDPAYGTSVVAGGGTGNTTFTAYSVITAGTTATGAFQNVSGVGSSGQVLTSNGAGALPTWQTASSGGTPGGSNTQLQYNNSSAFGGISGATSDGTNLFVPTLYGGSASGGGITIAPTTNGTLGMVTVTGSQATTSTSSSATTLTLDKTSYEWIYTGAVATTWTLPDLATTSGIVYVIKNQGSVPQFAVITLNRAGSDQLWTTSAVNTITINVGDVVRLKNNGSFWEVAYSSPIWTRVGGTTGRIYPLINVADTLQIGLATTNGAAKFYNAGTSRLDGTVAFGGANPASTSAMNGTYTSATAGISGYLLTVNSGVTSSATQFGQQISISATSTSASNTAVWVGSYSSSIYSAATGTDGTHIGMRGDATINSATSATITLGAGVSARVQLGNANAAAGTITNSYAFYSEGVLNNSAAADKVTNFADFHADTTASSLVTNTPMSFDIIGTNKVGFIASPMQIGYINGAKTSSALLAVGASTTTVASLLIANGTAPTSPTDGMIWNDGSNLLFASGTTAYTLNKSLSGSATLNFGSTAAGAASDLTINVTNAALGNPVILGAPNGSVSATDNVSFWAWVSSAGVVTVRFNNNNLVGAVDPASGTFNVRVIK